MDKRYAALRKALGDELRELRRSRHGDLSQSEVARKIGLDLGGLERGERLPSLGALWELAAAFKVSPSRMIARIDRRYRSKNGNLPERSPFATEMKHLREYMDEALTMKWLADRHEKTVYANRLLLKWLGVTLEELLGDAWKTTVHPEDMARYYPIVHRAFLRRRSCTTRFRMRNAQGEWAWVAQEAGPRYTPKGVFIGFIGTIIEIVPPDH